MNRFHLIASVAASLLAWATLSPQDPAETPADGAAQPADQDLRPPLIQYREARVAELARGLEGAWRLTRYQHAGEATYADAIEGFAIFRGGYGSIVMHANDHLNEFEFVELYQALVFHYRFDSTLRLQTSTIIGHDNFEDLSVVPEAAWTPREFDVDLLGNRLLLERPDGARMQFDRVLNDAFPEKTLELMREQRRRVTLPGIREKDDF